MIAEGWQDAVSAMIAGVLHGAKQVLRCYDSRGLKMNFKCYDSRGFARGCNCYDSRGFQGTVSAMIVGVSKGL